MLSPPSVLCAVFLMGDLEVSWVGKVVVTLLLLLRDWLMVLPLYRQDSLPPTATDTIRILFQVGQPSFCPCCSAGEGGRGGRE